MSNIQKMTRYSMKPRYRVYVKGYGFLASAKNIAENVSSKYSQKLIDRADQSAIDTVKTTSK